MVKLLINYFKYMTKKINLMVIFGGPSGEHEVSLNSAKSVIENLDKEKYQIITVAIDRQGKWLLGDKGQEYLKLNTQQKSIEEQIKKDEEQSIISLTPKDITNFTEGKIGVDGIDLVLPILHGPYGEDGKLQGMLDMLGLPYVFSNTLASSLAMNKPKTKLIAQDAGLNVLPEIVIDKNQPVDLDEIIDNLGLPIVVKPSELGSSVGINIANNKEDLAQAIKIAFKHDQIVMLEKYAKGRELTCGVLGNDPATALPIVEIIPQVSGFFDYKAKYEVGGSKEVCPAEVPEEIKDSIQDYSLKIYKAIGCHDLARADYIWDEENNKIWFLEINTIPGMTKTSLVPQQAKAHGLEFTQFLDELINEALKRYIK